MDATVITELLKNTRKVPKSGRQRCFRLSLELDSKLQEIADAAEALTGYNVSLAHVARMIIDTYHIEVLDALTGRVQEILETTMEDPDYYDKDIFESGSDEDLEDTEDDTSGEDSDKKDPEEEYIRSLLQGSAKIKSVGWGS